MDKTVKSPHISEFTTDYLIIPHKILWWCSTTPYKLKATDIQTQKVKYKYIYVIYKVIWELLK